MEKENIFSKIFLDSAIPRESREAKEILGVLAGQTTNPTLLAKNPEVLRQKGANKIFSEKELYSLYKKTAFEISEIVSGPISIEVYADEKTGFEKMLERAREFAGWIPNVCVKLPITKEGLKAASIAVKEGISVNMTLCFSQEQAAAVYSATKGALKPVFISPFVGRLDDKGENGMDLVGNILKMYKNGDGHVSVLAASIRNLKHLSRAVKIGSSFITVPLGTIKEWAEKSFVLPNENSDYCSGLKPIACKEIDLEKNWENYDIEHNLTFDGIKKFSEDWKNLVL